MSGCIANIINSIRNVIGLTENGHFAFRKLYYWLRIWLINLQEERVKKAIKEIYHIIDYDLYNKKMLIERDSKAHVYGPIKVTKQRGEQTETTNYNFNVGKSLDDYLRNSDKFIIEPTVKCLVVVEHDAFGLGLRTRLRDDKADDMVVIVTKGTADFTSRLFIHEVATAIQRKPTIMIGDHDPSGFSNAALIAFGGEYSGQSLNKNIALPTMVQYKLMIPDNMDQLKGFEQEISESIRKQIIDRAQHFRSSAHPNSFALASNYQNLLNDNGFITAARLDPAKVIKQIRNFVEKADHANIDFTALPSTNKKEYIKRMKFEHNFNAMNYIIEAEKILRGLTNEIVNRLVILFNAKLSDISMEFVGLNRYDLVEIPEKNFDVQIMETTESGYVLVESKPTEKKHIHVYHCEVISERNKDNIKTYASIKYKKEIIEYHEIQSHFKSNHRFLSLIFAAIGLVRNKLVDLRPIHESYTPEDVAPILVRMIKYQQLKLYNKVRQVNK